jgi:antitoxin ParD1/3/4
MNVSLTPELEAMIHEKVRAGLYQSASEVVREALRVFREREELRALRLAELRKQVAAGLEQYERGQVGPLDMQKVKARGRRRKVKG